MSWIHGNHDTDAKQYYDNLSGSDFAESGLDGPILDVAGISIAGVGGVFRGRIC